MNDMSPEKKQRSSLAKWSRRGFIGAGVLAGGGLLIGIGVRPGNPIGSLASKVATGDGEQLVNSWVKIDTNNIITAIVPHCEMGQGAHSVLAQMLADELDADWNNVRVMQAPADGNYVAKDAARMFVAPFTLNAADWIEPTWDGLFTQVAKLADAMITGGSSSIRSTGQNSMRVAGAAARKMLVGAAADEWGVPAEEITTKDSVLFHKASGNSGTYAEFATAAAEQPMDQTPTLKTPDQYRLMGKSKARTDIPAKINGTAEFGIDAVPNDLDLSYAAIVRPPVPGTKVVSMDAARAKSMKGVLQILNMGDFVAVVADSYWQAQQAINTVNIEWSQSGSPVKTMADQYAVFAAALDEAGETGGDNAAGKGDVPGALSGAAKTVDAEYKVPYLAHSPMEPLNCTAHVKDGKCDVWASTQVPLMARSGVASVLGLSAEDVTMNHPYLGGAFGRRLGVDEVSLAARVAQATGYPVKVIWSREEDTQKALYRCADTARMRAGIDEEGKLVAFDHLFTQRHDPAEACVPAMYDIANTSVRVAPVDLHLPFQAWRSVDHSQQGYFHRELYRRGCACSRCRSARISLSNAQRLTAPCGGPREGRQDEQLERRQRRRKLRQRRRYRRKLRHHCRRGDRGRYVLRQAQTRERLGGVRCGLCDEPGWLQEPDRRRDRIWSYRGHVWRTRPQRRCHRAEQFPRLQDAAHG